MFGTAKSKATRKAQRFFSERRVPVTFVDARKKPPTPGELRRFVQRLGVESVLDPDSKAYQDQGLRFVSASDDDWIDRMARNPDVIRWPLIRCDADVSAGDDEAAWQRFVAACKG